MAASGEQTSRPWIWEVVYLVAIWNDNNLIAIFVGISTIPAYWEGVCSPIPTNRGGKFSFLFSTKYSVFSKFMSYILSHLAKWNLLLLLHWLFIKFTFILFIVKVSFAKIQFDVIIFLAQNIKKKFLGLKICNAWI